MFRVAICPSIEENDIASSVLKAFPDFMQPHVLLYILDVALSSDTNGVAMYKVFGGNFYINQRLRRLNSGSIGMLSDTLATIKHGTMAPTMSVVHGILSVEASASSRNFGSLLLGNLLQSGLEVCALSSELQHLTRIGQKHDIGHLKAINFKYGLEPCQVMIVTDEKRCEAAHEAMADMLETANGELFEWTLMSNGNVIRYPISRNAIRSSKSRTIFRLP
jgi:hypothetical protein